MPQAPGPTASTLASALVLPDKSCRPLRKPPSGLRAAAFLHLSVPAMLSISWGCQVRVSAATVEVHAVQPRKLVLYHRPAGSRSHV
eukprot:CAMPEP_0119318396 /NCGR_PEP_ID=MMETSP1333-20130426/46261_1 /TAXON_ID=418940 /ORGANISM="Scyphosphaera apsteinii, Strain RCC1455" /LENGTH=85 /DNA_ID=CAMNT_0007324557 /DNA_START=206 /DNA_END=464 /DNA_ORIENTATION=-